MMISTNDVLLTLEASLKHHLTFILLLGNISMRAIMEIHDVAVFSKENSN